MLTDNEIRDIQKYLQSGKPLPDKYRFLLFEDKREVELVWNGKTNEVCNIVMPFQTIEQVDEPRTDSKIQKSIFDFGLDERGRQLKGWTNKLIWGDNKLILSSLKNGPLREEIEKQGGIKLIYIDPPFDVGADFSINLEIGEETMIKEANILEELAYRDTWGKGSDSYLAMIYERLVIMKDLLANEGTIWVHCDYRLNGFLKTIMAEVFGEPFFVNEITWKRHTMVSSVSGGMQRYGQKTDTILVFSKNENYIFNLQYKPSENIKELKENKFKNYEEETERWFETQPLVLKGNEPSHLQFLDRELKLPKGQRFAWNQDTLNENLKKNKHIIYWTNSGLPRYKKYLDEYPGEPVSNLWDDLSAISSKSSESYGYPTQKPEILLSRVINTASNEGDIVCDFFCGSGTTLAVAEKLGRKWIGSDLGKFAIHTTRKRLLDVQRQLKSEGKNYRAFEILNLGKYERQHYIGVNPNLRDEEKQKQLENKEKDFIKLILHAYKAEAVQNFQTFHGKKNNRLVAIGPINLPVTRLFVEEIINECRQKHITKVDILAFEFEMGLSPNIQEEAKSKGIDLALKYIPREVFDKRAVEKNQVVFNDVSYVEVKPHYKGKSVAIELTDFSVFYNQDSIKNAEESLKNGGSRIVVENGKIIKVTKNKSGIIEKEILTKKWTDWIDYWSVDYDFESKKEMIRVEKEKNIKQTGKLNVEDYKKEYEEVWTGDYIFENEWQTFRTKKNREINLKSNFKELRPGKHKVAIKVVDIFGNDTMKIIKVNIQGK